MDDHVHQILIVLSLGLWNTWVVQVDGSGDRGKELAKAINPLCFEVWKLVVYSVEK
jgi:hypothetical protein